MFRAKTGITPEQLQSAALAVTPVLSSMPGFISREFGESGMVNLLTSFAGKTSRQRNRQEKVMSIPVCGEFFGLIDQSQMQFMHFNKVT